MKIHKVYPLQICIVVQVHLSHVCPIQATNIMLHLEPNRIIHPYHHGVTIILLRTTFHSNIIGEKFSFRPDEANVEDLVKSCLKPVFFSVLLRN